jgi:predicted membrane metal-binding protein
VNEICCAVSYIFVVTLGVVMLSVIMLSVGAPIGMIYCQLGIELKLLQSIFLQLQNLPPLLLVFNKLGCSNVL